MKDVTNCT